MMISKYERNTDFMIFWQPLEDLAILIMKRNKCEEGIDGFGFEFVLMISQDCNHTFLSEAEVADKILCFGDNF